MAYYRNDGKLCIGWPNAYEEFKWNCKNLFCEVLSIATLGKINITPAIPSLK